MNNLVLKYLEIPEQLYDDFNACDIEYDENTGASDDGLYNYYFYIPEDMSPYLLVEMDWKVGDCIELPLEVFSEPDVD